MVQENIITVALLVEAGAKTEKGLEEVRK